MTMNERYGTRDLTYHRWRGQLALPFDDMNRNIPESTPDRDLTDLTYSAAHRPPHLPARHTMIDIDYVEYCSWCRTPLLLCETAIDLGTSSERKATWVLETLGRRARVPVSLVLYTRTGDSSLIDKFRISHRVPTRTDLRPMLPAEWRQWLTDMRSQHRCTPDREDAR